MSTSFAAVATLPAARFRAWWLVGLVALLMSMSTGIIHAQEATPEAQPGSAVSAANSPLPPQDIPQPPQRIVEDEGQWVVPYHLLGQGESIRLIGQTSQRDVFIPVPQGMDAEELVAYPVVSPDIIDGFLEVRSGDRLLALYDIPFEQAQIRIPLQNAIVQDQVLQLSLVARLRSADDICETQLAGGWLNLLAPTFALTNTASAPRSIESFFPPLLSRLRVFVPEQPTEAEAEVALKLATTITAQYPGQQLDVSLETLGDAPISGGDAFHERTIVIQQGPDDGIRLQENGTAMPILFLSGSAESLRQQGQVFAERNLSALMIAREANVLLFNVPEGELGTRFTFDELGIRNRQISGMGRLEERYFLSQGDFGSSVLFNAARLSGVYTPIQDGSQATLSVLFNATLLRAEPLDATGEFDLLVPIPRNLMQRDNELLLRVDYTPREGLCTIGMQPITLELNGNSYIQVTRGESLAPGFERFPQAITGGVTIAFETLELESLNSAVLALVELQRLTDTPIALQVRPWQDALDSREPLLLIGTREAVHGLEPPISAEGASVVSLEDGEVMRLELDQIPADLQAFESDGRNVLLMTGPDSGSIFTLIQRIQETEEGWFGLRGDFYAVSDSGVVNVRVRDVEPPQPSASIVSTEAALSYIWPAIYVAVVIVVLLFLRWAYPKVVRQEPSL